MVILGGKHVFWQAFVVASIIFWIGIFLGISFEKSRIERLESVYFDLETDIFDFQLASDIVFSSGLDCNIVNNKSLEFADEIYSQALKLEKFDESNKITEELLALHRRYDFLRTMLWESIIKNNKRCDEKLDTVVYLYQYKNPSLTVKAVQTTMSNFLLDLKVEKSREIVLIPIAADTNVEALGILMDSYDLKNYPVIFINEELKIEDLDSLKNISEFLNK